MMNEGVWTIDEHERCAESLIPHGTKTTYETMSKFVKTRTITQVRGYYKNRKNKLLKDSKKYANNNNNNDNLDDDMDVIEDEGECEKEHVHEHEQDQDQEEKQKDFFQNETLSLSSSSSIDLQEGVEFKYTEGSRVRGNFCAAKFHGRREDNWYDGTISKVHTNDDNNNSATYTYDIEYDDGDKEENVIPRNIRPLTSTNRTERSIEENFVVDHNDYDRVDDRAINRTWEEQFIRLQEFKKEFNRDVNVPRNSNYIGLGIWVSEQRRKFRDGRLQREPEKIKQLEDIGFQWIVRNNRSQKKQQYHANANNNNNNNNQDPTIDDLIINPEKKTNREKKQKGRDVKDNYKPTSVVYGNDNKYANNTDANTAGNASKKGKIETEDIDFKWARKTTNSSKDDLIVDSEKKKTTKETKQYGRDGKDCYTTSNKGITTTTRTTTTPIPTTTPTPTITTPGTAIIATKAIGKSKIEIMDEKILGIMMQFQKENNFNVSLVDVSNAVGFHERSKSFRDRWLVLKNQKQLIGPSKNNSSKGVFYQLTEEGTKLAAQTYDEYKEMKKVLSVKSKTSVVYDNDNRYENGGKTKRKNKKKKDPNHPKHPLSAFIYFNVAMRPLIAQEMKDKLGDFKFHDIGKHVAEKWHNISSEEKKGYEVKAKKDKERYNREMTDYRAEKKGEEDDDDTTTTITNNSNTNNKNVNRKKKRDPNAPKKYKTPYQLYDASIRSSVKIDNPDAKILDISRITANMWKDLPDKGKNVCVVMAADDKVRYYRELDEYSQMKKKNKRSDDDNNDDDSSESVAPTKRQKKSNDTTWTLSPPPPSQLQQNSKKEETFPNNRRLSRRQRDLEVESIDDNQITTTLRPFNSTSSLSKKSNYNSRARSSDFVYDFGSDDDDENYDMENVDDYRDTDFKPPPQKQQKKKSYNKKKRRSSQDSSQDEKTYESTSHTSNSNKKAQDSTNNTNPILSPRVVGIVLDGNKCYVSYAPV